MKNLLLLAFITFMSTFGYAQEVPDKANTIIVTLPDSNNVHDKVLKVLTNKGYTVNARGNKPKKITTEAKTLKNKSRMSLATELKGNEVVLTGNIVVVGQGDMRIEHKGKKGTAIMDAWEEMEKVAKSMGGKVSYEVK